MLKPSTAAFAAALAAAGAARAQPPGPPPGPPTGPRAAEMQAMRQAHARQRAEDLKTVLRLRADQQSALDAFLASDEPPAMDRLDGPPPQPPKPMTTPERLDEMARRDAEHRERQGKRVTALRTFYAALSPEQRQAFDALQRLQGPPLPGPRMIRIMHGGPGGEGPPR